MPQSSAGSAGPMETGGSPTDFRQKRNRSAASHLQVAGSAQDPFGGWKRERKWLGFDPEVFTISAWLCISCHCLVGWVAMNRNAPRGTRAGAKWLTPGGPGLFSKRFEISVGSATFSIPLQDEAARGPGLRLAPGRLMCTPGDGWWREIAQSHEHLGSAHRVAEVFWRGKPCVDRRQLEVHRPHHPTYRVGIFWRNSSVRMPRGEAACGLQVFKACRAADPSTGPVSGERVV